MQSCFHPVGSYVVILCVQIKHQDILNETVFSSCRIIRDQAVRFHPVCSKQLEHKDILSDVMFSSCRILRGQLVCFHPVYAKQLDYQAILCEILI